MKPYLLDNNVISELWKSSPDAAVLAWIQTAEWFLPVPVIAEIQEGADGASSAGRRIEINSNRSYKPDFSDFIYSAKLHRS